MHPTKIKKNVCIIFPLFYIHVPLQLWMSELSLHVSQSQSQSYFTTDGQSECLGVEPNLGLLTRDIIFFFFSFESYSPVQFRAPSLTRGRVCHLSVCCQYSL
jgi:hypothetical protein